MKGTISPRLREVLDRGPSLSELLRVIVQRHPCGPMKRQMHGVEALHFRCPNCGVEVSGPDSTTLSRRQHAPDGGAK